MKAPKYFLSPVGSVMPPMTASCCILVLIFSHCPSDTQTKVGKPNILVCNAAGEAPIGSLEKVEATVFDAAMISNVRNNLLLANLVAPDMVAHRDGSIIIMSSIVSSRGRPGMGVYATTKAAVKQHRRTGIHHSPCEHHG
jgi:NAD(P)-dependent dehydrogenase (short-subunit alcohol dehydrogenase family)